MTCAEKGIRRIRLGHQRWKTSSFVGKSSSFGTIQEYVHLEQVELRVDVDDGLPDPALEAAQPVSCNDHPPTYLRAAATICQSSRNRRQAPSGCLPPGHGRVKRP